MHAFLRIFPMEPMGVFFKHFTIETYGENFLFVDRFRWNVVTNCVPKLEKVCVSFFLIRSKIIKISPEIWRQTEVKRTVVGCTISPSKEVLLLNLLSASIFKQVLSRGSNSLDQDEEHSNSRFSESHLVPSYQHICSYCRTWWAKKSHRLIKTILLHVTSSHTSPWESLDVQMQINKCIIRPDFCRVKGQGHRRRTCHNRWAAYRSNPARP